MPKPPPTSGVMMRKLSAGTSNTSLDNRFLSSQPPWVLVRSVQRPVSASNSASAARASMEFTTMRLLTMLTRLTCAADANSCSVSSFWPISQSKTMFLSAVSHTAGEAGSMAAESSVTEGRIS